MFYCNLEHTAKKAIKTRSGKIKNGATAKNRFHYITRTSHFKNYKESISEQIEFVKSGNLPSFAEGKPAEFWQAADVYERSNGRTCSSLVVALPKELNQAQRIELAEAFITEFADRYRFPFSCAIHNHAGLIAGIEQPHLHLMYSERHMDGIDRSAEQFFKRYNPKDPQKGGAQKLTADVLGMGKAQLQLYRQKTEELINDSLMRYAPMKQVEIRGIQIEVPSRVSCLSHRDYNKKYGTQLQDVPVMNKAVRFACENEPELWAKQQHMIEEIQRIRAENRYEQYRSFYEAELKNRKEIEELSKQAETPRTRQQWYAREKLLFLQQNMLQTLLKDPQTTEPITLIQHDLQRYIDLLNTESFDRLEKLEYLRDLGQNLKGSVLQIAPIDEELEFMQRQVIERVSLKMREKAVTSEKVRNHDQDNDFSPGF
ncbi:MobA/MobL family protein [Acinetobacter bereziniae]|uniref:MobA/MobL family protein n=1 Tax=Acinetobacter bereziniae TaxID=106648 RepID=UPI00225AA566|nr:MobA/MobL family protein [Acinetobacter bereziniae]